MLEFISHSANTPFTLSLFIVLAFALFEGVGLVVGLSIMGWLDDISPFEMDVDLDAGDVTGTEALVAWLCLNRLPIFVWLLLFCTAFAVTGLVANYLALQFALSALLPLMVSTPVALVGALLACRYLGSGLAKLMPNIETSAMSQSSFSGVAAVLNHDNCRQGRPVEATLTDEGGTEQSVLVEPQDPRSVFNRGDRVILLAEDERGIWSIIPYQ